MTGYRGSDSKVSLHRQGKKEELTGRGIAWQSRHVVMSPPVGHGHGWDMSTFPERLQIELPSPWLPRPSLLSPPPPSLLHTSSRQAFSLCAGTFLFVSPPLPLFTPSRQHTDLLLPLLKLRKMLLPSLLSLLLLRPPPHFRYLCNVFLAVLTPENM